VRTCLLQLFGWVRKREDIQECYDAETKRR
jgi:hypothetical protein